MNKNTKKRLREYRKACKKGGGFPRPVFKAKKKPFPTIKRYDSGAKKNA